MAVTAERHRTVGRGAPAARRRHPVARRVGQALTILLAAGVVAAVAQYRRQIVSYATHLKGSPTHTAAYVPFPADDLPELRIAVAGDVGDSGSRIGATGAALTRLADDRPFDVLLLLGDNVYPRGNPKDIPARVFKPFAGVLDRGTELLVVVGNHDKRHSDEQLQIFGMPGHWWSAVRGDVLIVGLDSNLGANPQQMAFLDKTLAESTQRWKIVALHHPPYSAGYQGSSIGIRNAYVPIFERHGVQLVLSGHEHDYQRSRVINGITYVITGAASGTRRTGEADFTAASFSWHSYVEIGVYPDRLVGRALNQKDRVADMWVVTP